MPTIHTIEPMTISPRDRRHLMAAEGYVALEMYEHALRELRTIAAPGELQQTYRLLKAEAHRGLQDWSAALEEFELCALAEPRNLDVLMGMAWCLKRLNQLSRAIAMMHDAYQSHSDVPVVLYNLSCYYALGRQRTQALSWLARALRMEPGLRRLIDDETDFDPIRDTPEFQKLVNLLAKPQTT